MSMTAKVFEQRVTDCKWALTLAGSDLGYLRNAKLLDIGSGYGAMAIACERAGVAEYLGVEPWPFGAQVARLEGKDNGSRICYERAMPIQRRNNFTFFEGYLEKLVGPTDYFDVAILSDVLEHIPDASSIAKSAFPMMKPGGIILASTGPLYLSAMGHHLWDSPYGEPWAHLKPGYKPTLAGVSSYRLQNFLELGKCSHQDIKDWFESAGFEIVKDQLLNSSVELWQDHKQHISPELLNKYPEELFLAAASRLIFRRPFSVD